MGLNDMLIYKRIGPLLVAASVFALGACEQRTVSETGPFGIRIGQGLDGLKLDLSERTKELQGTGSYLLLEFPKPYPKLRPASIIHQPKAGICIVAAMSEVSYEDDEVLDFERDFSQLKSDLTIKYGNPIIASECQGLAAGKCASEHYIDVLGGTVLEAYVWKAKDSKLLKDMNVDKITLSSTIEFGSLRMYSLAYRGNNFDACLDEKKRKIKQNDRLGAL